MLDLMTVKKKTFGKGVFLRLEPNLHNIQRCNYNMRTSLECGFKIQNTIHLICYSIIQFIETLKKLYNCCKSG